MGKDYTLILGDCLDEMRKLKSKSVDVVFTSPPYNDSGSTESDKKKSAITNMKLPKTEKTGMNGKLNVLMR